MGTFHTDSSLAVDDKVITQNINKCELNGRAISVFSPVDIFVTDQDGSKLGLAEDKSVVNEIPGADFEVWGEHKFVFIPTDEGQTYTINLQGTGSGIFTIKSQDIQNSQAGRTEVFSNLPVTTSLTGQININSADNTTTLSLNNSPAPVLPSAILDAAESEDFLPPVTTVALTGEQGEPGFYRSDVKVNLSATDNLSGVLDIEYSLDNASYQKDAGGAAEIIISNEGSHTLTFFSTDRAGNNEPEKTTTFTIDKTAPEAQIQFDPAVKDLKFSSAESNVAVSDNDDKIVLTDQAGNTTEIKLMGKNRKILMSAEIKSIKYNGVLADISKNKMAFLWFYDKKGNLKMLSQHVKSKNDYNILAVYNGKNTRIIGKDSSGRISKTESGLKIIRITTDNGDLNWSY